MGRSYRVGTRTSPLALKQVEEVERALKKFYPDIQIEIVGIDTYGDRDKTTPISEIEGSDFFTREIDEILLKGEIDPSTTLRINGERSRTIDPSTTSLDFARDDPERQSKRSLRINGERSRTIDPSTTSLDFARDDPERQSKRSLRINGERSRTIDFAVHSAKDVPDNLREGLIIAAITDSIDPYDVLVSKSSLTLEKLPYGAKIGTSSLRRKEALRRYRADFQIVDIRGNIEERLKLLDSDKPPDLDAIVIAAAGLIRLGLENRITQRIPFEILEPHPLQGALAIEAREDDKEIIRLVDKLDARNKKGGG